MSGRISTHVLDTAAGQPASGVQLALYRVSDAGDVLVREDRTNADGRTNAPLLAGETFLAGTYRLVFHVAAYFRSRGNPDAGMFLDLIPIQFVVTDPDAGYHVPLLVSPWSYSTYRGS